MVYGCNDCDKKYKTKASLQEHIKLKNSKVHSSQCEKCDKQFLNNGSLKRHLNDTRPSKLHSCTYCESSFTVNRK
jgi:uncharacterized Zn-finger protein